MKDDLKKGLKGEWVIETTPEMAATHIADQGFLIYSTPSMVWHMERAAVEAIRKHLDRDEVSLGVHVDISHVAGTRIGETVRATARLVEIEGHRLNFAVEAYNERELIGSGHHRRVVVKKDRLRTQKRL